MIKEAEKYAKRIGKDLLCPDVLLQCILDSNSFSIQMIFKSLGVDSNQLVLSNALFLKEKEPSLSDTMVVKQVDNMAKEFMSVAGETDRKRPYEFYLSALCTLEQDKWPYLFRLIEEEKRGFIESLANTLIKFIKNQHIKNFSFFTSIEEVEDADFMINDDDEFQNPFYHNPILEEFATNLNIEALNGSFDGLVVYDDVLDNLYTTLCREKKKNAILIGPAGTGKTSKIELLAREIVNGDVPDLLRDKVIYDVHLSDMISGAIWRGQFEKRLCRFLDEAKRKKNIILFIDEIHTLVGAGTGGRSDDLDSSNILKPALARGEISCIGATTPSEYDNKIKTDPALERRFQQVMIYPPNSKQMSEILPNLIEHYENLHPVRYTDEFKDSLIHFCDTKLAHKTYPDKLVDILDSCAAKSKIDFFTMPENIRNFEKDLFAAVEKNSDNEELNDMYLKLQNSCDEWQQTVSNIKAPVTIDHLNNYLKENVYGILSASAHKEFIDNVRGKIFNQENVSRLDDALYYVNYSDSRIISIYGKSGSGRSYFLNSVTDCLKECGAQVLVKTRFNLFKNNILGAKNSLAKQISYYERPVVIIDDFDQISDEAYHILSDAFKTGLMETVDGQTVSLKNTTFILVTGQKAGTVGFDESIPQPDLSKDLIDLSVPVFIDLPSKANKIEYFSRLLDKLPQKYDFDQSKITSKETYDSVKGIFTKEILPLAVKEEKEKRELN